MTMSSSAGLSSIFKLYLNPEHPPGSTAIRSPAVSGETFSSAMNFLTSTAAESVTARGATTCGADPPLVAPGLGARRGMGGTWLGWTLPGGGMLRVFFSARLWRRAGVMTDIEFSEIRYAGPPAAFLRGFRALYLGIPINCIILGWVNLAMVKILQLLFNVGKLEALAMVLGLIVLTSTISTLSGLWGVLVTDLFQFVIKMSMVIVLAVVAGAAGGGGGGVENKIRGRRGGLGAGLLA